MKPFGQIRADPSAPEGIRAEPSEIHGLGVSKNFGSGHRSPPSPSIPLKGFWGRGAPVKACLAHRAHLAPRLAENVDDEIDALVGFLSDELARPFLEENGTTQWTLNPTTTN